MVVELVKADSAIAQSTGISLEVKVAEPAVANSTTAQSAGTRHCVAVAIPLAY